MAVAISSTAYGLTSRAARRSSDAPRQLAQHQHAVVVLPRQDELAGHEVHAVAQRRDQHDVRRPVQGREIGRGHRLATILDRQPVRTAEARVDRADQRLDVAAQAGVRRNVLARRDRDLDELDLPAQLRLLGEQALIRRQTRDDPLGVVEAIDAEEPAARRVARQSDGGRFGARRPVRRALRVHADRIRADANAAAIGDDARSVGVILGEQADRIGEVRGVARRLETDHVCAEHAVEDLAAPRQHAKDVGGGKRRVQEEPDPRLGNARADQRRRQQQVIVVNPDDVARLVLREHQVRKAFVDGAVGLKVRQRDGQAIEQVVQDRPQHAVADAVVVAADVVGAERHRHDAARMQAPKQLRARVLVGGRTLARPADPDMIAALVHGTERRGQPAGRRCELESVGAALHGKRQTVRSNQQAWTIGHQGASSPFSVGRAHRRHNRAKGERDRNRDRCVKLNPQATSAMRAPSPFLATVIVVLAAASTSLFAQARRSNTTGDAVLLTNINPTSERIITMPARPRCSRRARRPARRGFPMTRRCSEAHAHGAAGA